MVIVNEGDTLGAFSRGKDWHYYSSTYGRASPKERSRFPIPEAIRQNFLPDYHKICMIHFTYDFSDRKLICAIPEKGGPYLVLSTNPSDKDINEFTSEQGLRAILNSDLQ
jgi:hypothetical protein